ncbi:helix-turn-helix domain-containing protein [Thalassoroseus pseudoceratinae]|uniref:helix-turn-helix domain-containing protein n=1 Tax=Thalassoroseus pseudoceratinae TaxID=2713176 RepID=UPI0014223A82|nr:helix-turn-helix domain-containing protein [Thalassoroseus pseudoceratinae]
MESSRRSGGKSDRPDPQLQLDFSGRRRILREWLTDDSNVKHLLRVLMDHASNGTECFLTIATIAREMSVKSNRTVQNAIREAERLGFLIVYGPRPGRSCNTYRLRIAEMRDAAEFEWRVRQLWNSNHDGCQSQFRTYRKYLAHRQANAEGAHSLHPTPANPAGDPCKICTPHPHILHPEALSKHLSKPPPKPATPGSWEMVEGELKEFGILHPRSALDSARGAGCSAGFVHEVIDYCRSKCTPDGTPAWGPGELHRRIRELRPGQSIDDPKLWSKPSAEYLEATESGTETDGEIERLKRFRERTPRQLEALVKTLRTYDDRLWPAWEQIGQHDTAAFLERFGKQLAEAYSKAAHR